MSVNGVSGAGGVGSSPQITKVNSDGTIEISFQGNKQTVNADDFTEMYNYVNCVAMEIAELEAKGDAMTSSDRVKLGDLKSKLARQRAAASFEVKPDGSGVVFTLKQDINVEEFKALFYIDDAGAFRDELKKEAFAEGRWADADDGRAYSSEGEPYSDWFDAWCSGVERFENGVAIKTDPDGHLYPDYTGATLSKGCSYTVGQSYIDPPNKPWYQFW